MLGGLCHVGRSLLFVELVGGETGVVELVGRGDVVGLPLQFLTNFGLKIKFFVTTFGRVILENRVTSISCRNLILQINTKENFLDFCQITSYTFKSSLTERSLFSVGH